ncbi:MAG: efflux RND transporter periplasmic adaptor subunit [bacterium]
MAIRQSTRTGIIVVSVLVLLVGAFALGSSGWLTRRSQANEMAGMKMSPNNGVGSAEIKAVEGHIRIDAAMQQKIGVRTVPVEFKPLSQEIRTVGRVEYDESAQHEITTRVMGYISTLFVNTTGQEIKPGDALYTFYSPDLVAAQQEYLLAKKAVERLGNSTYPEVAEGSRSLLESARKRLELWNFSDEQVSDLEARGTPQTDIPVYSEVAGTVVEKMAVQGKQIMPGEALFKIADLSTVWVIADFYESDASALRVGQMGMVDMIYFPGRTLHGTVDFIYPYLDDKTRTVKARLVFRNVGLGGHAANSRATEHESMAGMDMPEMEMPEDGTNDSAPDWLLKPGMFVNVSVNAPVGSYLVVPDDAVIDTGLRQTVFVDEGDGHFGVRLVTVGPRVSGQIAILFGLKAGERVVSGATFLLDAESKLETAMPAMPGMDMRGAPSVNPLPGGEGKSGAMPGMKMGGESR